MKIWRLGRLPGCEGDWDSYEGFVIRAASGKAARALAVTRSRESEWADRTKTSCEVIRSDGAADVLFEDFRAG